MPFQVNATNTRMGENRSHQRINLALEQSRQPSITNDIELSVVMILSNSGTQSGDITRYDIDISPDNSTWTNISADRLSPLVDANNYQRSTVVLIPAGWWYRISSRFSTFGNVQINTIYELIL